MRRMFATLAFAFAIPVLAGVAHAQTFTSAFRKTSASYSETGAQQQWDEWETPPPDAEDSDSETNRNFGQWRSDIEFNNPNNFPTNPANIWTLASQDSDIDTASGTFWFYGGALSSIYVQGDAESEAASRFRFDFQLASSGRLVLQGVIGVSNFFGRDQARDTSGRARVVVRLVDRNTNQTVFRQVKSMNAVPGTRFLDEFEFDDEEIDLDAGTYRFIVNATSSDSAVYDQVNFSLANAFVELEGWVEED